MTFRDCTRSPSYRMVTPRFSSKESPRPPASFSPKAASRWASGWEQSFTPPSKSAIFQARRRLDDPPLAALFARVARPIGSAQTPGVWLARGDWWRSTAAAWMSRIPDNDAHFGRPGVSKGEKSAFPQARVVALAECGKHANFDAAVGGNTKTEISLAKTLLDRLQPGMLLLADRGFTSYALWPRATATGANLLWRAKTGLRPEQVQTLEDDTWLAWIRLSTDNSAKPITVRVVDFTVQNGCDNPEPYQLFTSILDPGGLSHQTGGGLRPALGDRAGR